MGATTTEGSGAGSAAGALRGLTLDNLHRVLASDGRTPSTTSDGSQFQKEILETRTTSSSDTSITAENSDDLIIVTATSDVTVSLPDPTTYTGRGFVIKRVNSSTSSLTLTPPAGFNIEGASSWQTIHPRIGVQVKSTGSEWAITAWYHPDEGSESSAYKAIFSSTLNFKTVADYTLYVVPADKIFLIDSMEIVTTAITGAGTAPTVRFGNSVDRSKNWGPTITTSNTLNFRHVIGNPQHGAAAGTSLSGGITVGSTATSHSGNFIIRGTLLDV
jgi:hypothetical protein